MTNEVFKMLQRGTLVVVPRPPKRAAIVIDTHRGMGHFRVQQALDRLHKNYWWRGMGDAAVKSCLPCVRTTLFSH